MKPSIVAIILACVFLAGCRKKEGKAEIPETYFFTGSIDNNPIRWEVNAVNNATDTSRYNAKAYYFYSQWGVDCTTTDCYDIGAGTVVQERNRGNAIQVVFLKSAKNNDLTQFKPSFSPGIKSFGSPRTSAFTSTTNGILVRYLENGREWKSESGDQTGSSFESIEFKEATTDKDAFSNIWKARFTCKVYFNGLPAKTLQNCEIFGPAFYNR